MDSQDVIDLGRQAIVMTMLASAPMLVAGLVVGLVVGLLQAVTQIQEQTVAFVPKLVAMIVALALTLPWLLGQMTRYVQDIFLNIPELL
jgi:flagellar biosynthetic protein FliQ